MRRLLRAVAALHNLSLLQQQLGEKAVRRVTRRSWPSSCSRLSIRQGRAWQMLRLPSPCWLLRMLGCRCGGSCLQGPVPAHTLSS